MSPSIKYKNLEESQTTLLSYFHDKQYTHINLYFDGLNHFIRNFSSGYGTLQNAEGKDISGLYYSINSLISIIKFFVYENITRNDIDVSMVLEHRRSPKLKSIYPEYKQNRKAPTSITLDEIEKNEMFKYNLEEFVSFCKMLPKDILTYHMNLVEGDFIISYLLYDSRSKRSVIDKTLDVIVSTDKDFYQLLYLNDLVIFNPNTYKLVDKDNFYTALSLKSKIDPNSFLLYKLLSGDPSDNIKGITGKITAEKVINMLNSLTSSSITNFDEMVSLTENYLSTDEDKRLKIPALQYKTLLEIVKQKEYLSKILRIITLSHENILDILTPDDILMISKLYEDNLKTNDNRGKELKSFFDKHNFDSSFLVYAERYLFTHS